MSEEVQQSEQGKGAAESTLPTAEEKIAQLTAMLQHVQADFVNYRNRVERDRTQSIQQASKDLIMKLIPILDIFDLALGNAEQNDTTIGFKMVHDQLLDVLKQSGVEIIESAQVPVNPEIHEVIGTVDVEGNPGKVHTVVKKGYKLFDKVIRAAQVKTFAFKGCGSGKVMADEMKRMMDDFEHKSKQREQH